jgi:hypothetical protein
MFIVQRIWTEWTKRSRGGDAAVVRNAVPDSLPLPPPSSIGEDDGLLHDVRYCESIDFRPQSTVRPIDIDKTWEFGSLALHRRGDQVTVRFVWSWHATGAPERKSHDAFVLAPGQWGRLKCNGRFADADSGTWWYQQDVFNVAWIEALDPNRFLNTMPDFDVADLARLW